VGEVISFRVSRPIYDHSYVCTWWLGPGTQWPCECRQLYQFVIEDDIVELHCARCRNTRRMYSPGAEHGIALLVLDSGKFQKVGMAPSAQRVG
jgi:hypothetical protein